MFHGREELEDIQPPPGKYPADLPGFLLMGFDLAAPDAIEKYAASREAEGQHKRAASARKQRDVFIAWQKANPEWCKWPVDPVD
ncbi:hypothetical protein ACFWYW_59305 [Nonomuraea sp. NPDC059023]|uniref:hypothetical protein n=1 Tax=unclassified Nonomuraea TaxID=2593643 RepID=UPI00368FC615